MEKRDPIQRISCVARVRWAMARGRPFPAARRLAALFLAALGLTAVGGDLPLDGGSPR